MYRPGVPLEPGSVRTLAHRFGFDLSAVRIHADPAAASSAGPLGARAFTWGRHVVFARGAYQPRTARGQALLAHEMTHVGQQLGGSTASEEAQERQADTVEAGGSFARTRVGAAPPRLALRLRPGDAVSLTIGVRPDGSASFSAEVEGGGTVTAAGAVTQLVPGEYRVRALPGAQMVITMPDGPVVPRTTRFDVPWNAGNAALIRALSRVNAPIPLHVQSGTPVAAPDQPQTPPPGSEEAQRRELTVLPERIRNFLFTPGGAAPRPGDYAALLRIAQSIADLSDAELAEYRARTAGSTDDVPAFEASVNRWLAELRASRRAERDLDEATQALFGLDAIYEMYRSWQRGLAMGVASWIAEWEALPVGALPAEREGPLNQLYLRLRRALAPHGYANLGAFTTAIQRFLDAFRENAYHIGLDLLDRYEHVLVEQNARYQGGATALYTSLAPARATFRGADEYLAAARAQYGGWSPSDVSNFYAAGGEYRRRIAQGRAQVAAQASASPLLANRDFPQEELGRAANPSEVARIQGSYIASGLERVRNTRNRLRADHEIVFRLDVLVAPAKARQGIRPDSVWAKAIEDHQAPTIDEVALEAMAAVLALALGLLSGGSVPAAVAALGVSSYLALQQYAEYAFRADAYGAQLLSEEPSLAWVVLAIVGVVADFAAVSRVIQPIRPALREFQRTGELAALEAQLGGVEARIRQSILRRAELEVQARRGWESVVPPGALRGSAFGLDFAVDLLGKAVYSIQLNLRRGINTFNRWALTREAVDLIGDINRLGPAELRRARALYRQAVADTQRIATHGRTLGMAEAEVDAAIQTWARRGSGTADDVMHEMTASRAAQRGTEEAAAAESAWTPPASWNGPVRHGHWNGARGNSGWIDDRPQVIRIVGRSASGDANPIPFREGVVDFSRWSQGEVPVPPPPLIGQRAARRAGEGSEMRRIYFAIAEQRTLLPGASRTARENAALDWLRTAPDGYGGTGLSPHHVGGNRLHLIPRDLHRVHHTDLFVYLPGE